MSAPWGGRLPGNAWDLLADQDPPARSVSVVVAHFEQPEQLARTLAALARQTLAPTEVIVVDDGSREAPVVPDGVTLLRQEDRGFRASAARHLGATHATGDVLVFLDADTTPEPAFLDALTCLPRMAPDLLVVGRRRHADLAGLDADVPVEEAGPERELPEPTWLAAAYARSRDLLDADDLSCRFVISAVLSCSRWWYAEAGGFDPGFTAYGGEDWELAHRSWLAGGMVAHVPEAVAWHDGPDAGAAPRGVKTSESVAVAGRVGVPGLAPHGLLGLGGRRVPVDRLLALPEDADWADDATVLLLADAALAADPGAHLLLTPAHAALLEGDPRVVARGPGTSLESALATGARVLVELHRPWSLDRAGWRRLLRGHGLAGADGSGTGTRSDAVGFVESSDVSTLSHVAESGDADGPVATSTALRLVRRALRWGEDLPGSGDRGATYRSSLGGRPLPADLTPESWWGGWGAGAPRS